MNNVLWSINIDLKEGDFLGIITKSVEFNLISDAVTFELFQIEDKRVFELIQALKMQGESNMTFTLYKDNQGVSEGTPVCVIKVTGLSPVEHNVKFESIPGNKRPVHIIECVFDEWELENSENDA